MTNILFKMFGKSNTMKVLDYLLDLDIDVTINDICKGTNLTRKTVDKIISNLKNEMLIEVTRSIGNAQMYKINSNNPVAKKLIEINNAVLKSQEKKLEQSMGVPA